MSNAHTPGPWRAKTSRAIVAPRSHTNVYGAVMHYEAELAWTQPVPEREGGERTRLANARLIAAAPDLLAALRALHNVCPVECDFHGNAVDRELDAALNAALAAIAKATGGKTK